MSGFNTKLAFSCVICIHFWAGSNTQNFWCPREKVLYSNRVQFWDLSPPPPYFTSPSPPSRRGNSQKELFQQISRCCSRSCVLKKQFRNDANEPEPSGVWGWDCSAGSSLKAATGGGGALASSPSTYPHPPLPTSVWPLALFQSLLQLFLNPLQDSSDRPQALVSRMVIRVYIASSSGSTAVRRVGAHLCCFPTH